MFIVGAGVGAKVGASVGVGVTIMTGEDCTLAGSTVRAVRIEITIIRISVDVRVLWNNKGVVFISCGFLKTEKRNVSLIGFRKHSFTGLSQIFLTTYNRYF